MLLNRSFGELIEELKAEQSTVADFVHMILRASRKRPSILEAVLEGFAEPRSAVAAHVVVRRKSYLGPLDAHLDAGGCKDRLLINATTRRRGVHCR